MVMEMARNFCHRVGEIIDSPSHRGSSRLDLMMVIYKVHAQGSEGEFRAHMLKVSNIREAGYDGHCIVLYLYRIVLYRVLYRIVFVLYCIVGGWGA